MNAGKIEQAGTPLDLYERPATRFVAGFSDRRRSISSPASLPPTARLKLADGQMLTVPATGSRSMRNMQAAPVELGIRPQHVGRSNSERHKAQVKSTIELVQPTAPAPS